MPLAPTPCKDPLCHAIATSRGACDEHQREAWQGSNRKQTLPKDWNTRRNIVLKRDKGICHICGEPGSDSVDHVIPGEDHSLENLSPAHLNVPPYCHRYKSSVEGNKARGAYRVRERK